MGRHRSRPVSQPTTRFKHARSRGHRPLAIPVDACDHGVWEVRRAVAPPGPKPGRREKRCLPAGSPLGQLKKPAFTKRVAAASQKEGNGSANCRLFTKHATSFRRPLHDRYIEPSAPTLAGFSEIQAVSRLRAGSRKTDGLLFARESTSSIPRALLLPLGLFRWSTGSSLTSVL